MTPRRPTTAYTDGACLGNPGPGGWAFVVDAGPYASGAARETTNQRMEITAASEAVRRIDGPVDVVSDSTYVVKCFEQSWWKEWQARGWKNSKRQPVANRDLWEPFVDLVNARGDVTFRWVKGHSGDPLNDAADRLATVAATEQRGVRGDVFDPAIVAASAEDPEEHLRQHGILVTGVRPPALGGYDAIETFDRVRDRLTEILVAKRAIDPEAVVISGLQLGSDQLGVEAAIEAGMPYVVVLPYPDPERVWPREARARFAELRAGARQVIVLSRSEPRSKQEAGRLIGRRDDWLAEHAREAVVVWDRAEPGVGRRARALERALEDVWVVEP